MTVTAKLSSERPAVDGTGRYTRETQQVLEQLVREINSITGVSGIDRSNTWWASSGTFPAGNPTVDLVVPFKRGGEEIATRTIRGTLTTATGAVAAADQANTGEATTVEVVTVSADSVRAEVRHTASGRIACARFYSVDDSAAGSVQY